MFIILCIAMCGCMHVYVYALVLVVQFNYISKWPTTYIVLTVYNCSRKLRQEETSANLLCYNFGEISLANCY